jgi:hypothetical protein
MESSAQINDAKNFLLSSWKGFGKEAWGKAKEGNHERPLSKLVNATLVPRVEFLFFLRNNRTGERRIRGLPGRNFFVRETPVARGINNRRGHEHHQTSRSRHHVC